MSFKALTWALEQTDVEGLEKFVLFMVAYRDNHDSPHGCFPSLERIAKDCGIARSTAAQHITSLEEKNKIKKTNRFDDKGNQLTNYYELPSVWGDAGSGGGSPESGLGVVQRLDQGSPESGREVVRNLDTNRQLNRQLTSKPNLVVGEEESLPSKEREDPAAAYRIAKSIFRKYCRGALGNLGEKQREEWSSFIHTYGEVKGLGAFTVWARELGLEAKKFKYPIALFLKDPAEFIEAYEIESSPMPAEEEKEEDRMLTAKDIIRERERRG